MQEWRNRRFHELSSSSRRTWIEINLGKHKTDKDTVVLLAEDVDRNDQSVVGYAIAALSSSSRRTWIEIEKSGLTGCFRACRPPRGGRG